MYLLGNMNPIVILLIGISCIYAIDLRSLHFKSNYDCPYCQPEQVHIAFGNKTNDIVITWSTFNHTHESVVQYGETFLDRDARGGSRKFVDSGREHRSQFIHTVTLSHLKYNTRYVYHVGSRYGWSEEFSFKTPPAGEDWVVRAALYGDMGNQNAQSLSYLQDEAQRGRYDVVLHVGDFAYDMDTDDARVGDQFMRQIQPLAALVPYMTCPGNHEEAYNFSNYKARFSMPGGERMFYSFDLGPVHFISVDTEYYYFLQYGIQMVQRQYDWLVRDLQEADKLENRRRRPWIVMFGHRPMYCSNSDDIDCSVEYTRTGISPFGFYRLEPLLNEFGVDVVIWAHEHSYERTWPLYDQRVYNGSLQQPYTNPGAPVHIITGSAGCREGRDRFRHTPFAWSAFQAQDYGYTKFKAYNKTHIYLEQISVDLGGQVIDSMWLVKTKLRFDRHAAEV